MQSSQTDFCIDPFVKIEELERQIAIKQMLFRQQEANKVQTFARMYMKLDVGYKSEVDLTADEEAIRFFKPSKVRIASALSRKPSHEIYKDAMIPI